MLRIAWWCWVWIACSPARPSADDEAPAWRGECDASAVVAVGDHLLVATDEGTTLTRYDRAGALVDRIELAAALEAAIGGPLERNDGEPRELDLEGVERVGERLWWIGSHGLDKKGRARPNRRLLFATTLPDPQGGIAVVGRPTDLSAALLALPDLGPQLASVASIAPKEGGLDIEGLTVDPANGHLLVGLRSPIQDGRAWVVEVTPPSDDPNAAPQVTVRARLDLGGRGVRSLLWSAARGVWVIVAGPPGDHGAFALYTWDGRDRVTPLPVELGDLRPEGAAEVGDGLLLVSDDGSVERGGEACKDRRDEDPSDPRVHFRALTVPLSTVPRSP